MYIICKHVIMCIYVFGRYLYQKKSCILHPTIFYEFMQKTKQTGGDSMESDTWRIL